MTKLTLAEIREKMRDIDFSVLTTRSDGGSLAGRPMSNNRDVDFDAAFALYERSRVARTARVVLSAREMGRIFHARGVERLVRNDLWRERPPERFYDALEWLYGWTAAR